MLKLSLTGVDSQPVAGARAALLAKYLRPHAHDAQADVPQTFTESVYNLAPVETDAQGNATLLLPADARSAVVYVYKPGEGFDYQCFRSSRDPKKSRGLPADGRVAMQLGPTRKLAIHFREPDKKPIAGLELELWFLQKPGEPEDFNFSWTERLFHTTTDAAGVAHFDDLPAWDGELHFMPRSREFPSESITWDPAKKPDGKIRVTLARYVTISGKVELPDGRPASEIRLMVRGSSATGSGFDGGTTTDEAGKFEAHVAPDQLYMLVIDDDEWGAAPINGLAVHPGEPVTGLKVKLRPATRVSGRVVVGPNRRPLAGQHVMLMQLGRSSNEIKDFDLPPHPQGLPYFTFVDRQTETDSEGRYEFHVGPGRYSLTGPSEAARRGEEQEQFEVVGQTELKFDITVPERKKGEGAPREGRERAQ